MVFGRVNYWKIHILHVSFISRKFHDLGAFGQITGLEYYYYYCNYYTVFQKSDTKIQSTITTAYLIRIKYPLSGLNYNLSEGNVANFNKIHRTFSEQQLF